MRPVSILLLITLLTTSLSGQQRVGLVLSGGGAKGIAHIGVIKALEENNIPIDYIVGTSMGAVVGAFYAAGYSPEEIEAIVINPTFQDWVNGTSTEKYQYNYTKSQDDASWLTLDLILDAKLGAKINTPLANDLIINFVLNEYLTQASKKADFDFGKLFVPFKSVAADVFTQKTVAIDSGSIMEAVRSSMAVPFFYRPIKYENQYLFDGGIYDNFPVDIMREGFAPDLIIGSNVATKKSDSYPFDKDEEIINDALLFMFLDKTDPKVLGDGNVYIEPDVFGLNALDFDKAKTFVKLGYEAGIKGVSQVKNKVKRSIDSKELKKKRKEFRESFEPYLFGELKLTGFNDEQKGFIEKLIDFDSRKRSIDEVSKAYFQLVSEPYFKNVYPNFSYNSEANHYVLELFLKPTAKNALSLDFGGNLSTRQVSTLQLGFKLNSFRRKLNTYKFNVSTGRFYEALNLAARLNINPKNRFFIEPNFVFNHWDYLNTDDVFDAAVDPIVIDRIDRKLGVTFGIGTGQRSVITLDANVIRNSDEYGNQSVVSSNDIFDRLELTSFVTGLNYERNSLNKKQFPTFGSRFYASARFFYGSSNYVPGSTSVLFRPNRDLKLSEDRNWISFKVGFDEYIKIGKKYTFGWMFESQYSSIRTFENYRGTLLYLPAFEPLFDSETYFLDSYRAQGYSALGMKNILDIGKNLDFRFELYAFSPFKGIRLDANQNAIVEKGFQRPTFMGMAALIYNTIPGPISLRLNYIQENNVQFGLMLSFGYLIFNQKSHD